MAIALRGAAASWSSGINSFTVAVPAAQLTGDMMILVVMGKPFNLGCSVTDWTSIGSGASGSTGAGADVGSMKVEVFYRIATSDAESNPTVTEGIQLFNIAMGKIYVFSKDSGEAWQTPVAVFGGDESSGTGISITFGSDPGGVAGDYVMLACGINTESMGPLTAALNPSWTGITFGSPDTANDNETTSGGDMSGHVISYPVSSGTSSAAPTCTGTGTASAGADMTEAAFIRLRASVPSTAIKSVLGLAQASVKTVNGLAIASVKSVNGLT